MSKGVKLHNQGVRTIQFGTAKNEVVEPKKMVIVSAEVAKKLLKLYSGELIDIDSIAASYDVSKAQDFTAMPAKDIAGAEDATISDDAAAEAADAEQEERAAAPKRGGWRGKAKAAAEAADAAE